MQKYIKKYIQHSLNFVFFQKNSKLNIYISNRIKYINIINIITKRYKKSNRIY